MVRDNSIWHGIGLGIFLSVVVSTILGWLGLGHGVTVTIILYLICYLPAGYLVAYLNPEHPYTLAAIAGIILSLLNQAIIIYFVPDVLFHPAVLNLGILGGIIATLIGAIPGVQFKQRRLKREG